MALSAAPAVGFIESLQGDLAGTAALQAAPCACAAGGFDGGALFAEDAYRAQPFTDATTVPDATGVTAATDARVPRPERCRGRRRSRPAVRLASSSPIST